MNRICYFTLKHGNLYLMPCYCASFTQDWRPISHPVVPRKAKIFSFCYGLRQFVAVVGLRISMDVMNFQCFQCESLGNNLSRTGATHSKLTNVVHSKTFETMAQNCHKSPVINIHPVYFNILTFHSNYGKNVGERQHKTLC